MGRQSGHSAVLLPLRHFAPFHVEAFEVLLRLPVLAVSYAGQARGDSLPHLHVHYSHGQLLVFQSARIRIVLGAIPQHEEKTGSIFV
jgi:hypothetical protein